jgi:hypothetical protein
MRGAMGRPRKPRPFWVYYYDDKGKEFTITGPISDDSEVSKVVLELRRRGAELRMSTVWLDENPTKEPLKRRGPPGYAYTDESLVQRWEQIIARNPPDPM